MVCPASPRTPPGVGRGEPADQRIAAYADAGVRPLLLATLEPGPRAAAPADGRSKAPKPVLDAVGEINHWAGVLRQRKGLKSQDPESAPIEFWEALQQDREGVAAGRLGRSALVERALDGWYQKILKDDLVDEHRRERAQKRGGEQQERTPAGQGPTPEAFQDQMWNTVRPHRRQEPSLEDEHASDYHVAETAKRRLNQVYSRSAGQVIEVILRPEMDRPSNPEIAKAAGVPLRTVEEILEKIRGNPTPLLRILTLERPATGKRRGPARKA